MHNILVNNYWLENWKLLEHNKCTFCDTGMENILHLFWECELIKEFWLKLELRCENKLQVSRFQFEKDKVFLGEIGGEPWKNYIIMLGKRYIYQCRCSKIELSEIGFEKYLVQYMNIENTIAKDNKKVTDLFLLEKWSV